ncbi:MAG: undecaprenyldiphospho-muramoylpentapeptide beta-N-acetylglucosaminyltransferase [Verrucomicrobiota bacterium]
MKVLIACGGTGGHLFPGLAVAEMLASRRHEVKLLVSEKAVDQAALKNSAITVRPVAAVGYTGAGGLVRFCVRLARAVGDCVEECRQFEPDAVLGMGGFTSAPAVFAASWRRRGVKLIHESNAVPGKANRWSGKLADHIAVGVPDCAKFFGRKPVTVTGTPIRQTLRQGKVTGAHERLGLDRSRLTVLVMGGSQGAQAVNEAVVAALPGLADWKEQMQFVHLSGPRDETMLRAAYEKNGFQASVMSFCSEMELPYSAADLVIARSGAATLTELAVFGLPAILLPYPHAAGNHQWHNAKIFERIGAARIAEPVAQLPAVLLDLLNDAGKRAGMAQAAQTLAVTDAAERIANLVETYAH